jgi:hypothetical protein
MSETQRQADMKTLAQMFFAHLRRDRCEYGGIGIDSKRPFGNSDVEGDILEGIGCKPEGDDGAFLMWRRWRMGVGGNRLTLTRFHRPDSVPETRKPTP